MELDTAVRHKLPVIVVISLNGGWTADPERQEGRQRDLGYTRFDKMAEALGCHGEYVEKPDDIRPALERAKKANAEGKVGARQRRDRRRRPRPDRHLRPLPHVAVGGARESRRCPRGCCVAGTRGHASLCPPYGPTRPIRNTYQ